MNKKPPMMTRISIKLRLDYSIYDLPPDIDPKRIAHKLSGDLGHDQDGRESLSVEAFQSLAPSSKAAAMEVLADHYFAQEGRPNNALNFRDAQIAVEKSSALFLKPELTVLDGAEEITVEEV